MTIKHLKIRKYIIENSPNHRSYSVILYVKIVRNKTRTMSDHIHHKCDDTRKVARHNSSQYPRNTCQADHFDKTESDCTKESYQWWIPCYEHRKDSNKYHKRIKSCNEREICKKICYIDSNSTMVMCEKKMDGMVVTRSSPCSSYEKNNAHETHHLNTCHPYIRHDFRGFSETNTDSNNTKQSYQHSQSQKLPEHTLPPISSKYGTDDR